MTEYQQLLSTGTFEWVNELLKGHSAIGGRLVYRRKKGADGEVVKLKTQCVAKGFSQLPGRDFNPLYVSSSVFWSTTFRVFMTFIAHQDWELHQVDVVGAYLQGDLEEEIYMHCPPGYPSGPNVVWRLKKSLYGLKQAGREWYKNIRKEYESQGFTRILCT